MLTEKELNAVLKEDIENMENDDFQNGCYNCKHCNKLITEEPCMDCDPRTDSPKNHWEAEDGDR